MSWKGDTYDEIVRNFKWDIPEYFNIGVDICDKWADDKYRLALIFLDQDGKGTKNHLLGIEKSLESICQRLVASRYRKEAIDWPFSCPLRRRP